MNKRTYWIIRTQRNNTKVKNTLKKAAAYREELDKKEGERTTLDIEAGKRQ